MVNEAIFLLLGEDGASRDKQLSLLKSRFKAAISGVAEFNINDVDGRKLTIKDLQEILKRLPVDSQRRLLIIRQADYLSVSGAQCLIQFIKGKDMRYFRLILCASLDRKKPTNRLIAYLQDSKIAKIIYCRERRGLRVFDLARNIIDDGDAFSCLWILRQLLAEGKQPPQILGGLFWYWNNTLGEKTHRKGLEKGLDLFLDTDVKIKTGKIAADLALELLVVKLCQRVGS